ncbi:MAG: CpaF family protein [Kiritimatiellia bacterium]
MKEMLEPQRAEGGRTRCVDMKSALGLVEEREKMRRVKIQELKARLLGRVQENEELRRMNLDVLEGAMRMVALRSRTEDIIRFELGRFGESLSPHEREALVKEVLDEALELGPLEDLLKDDSVEEIMVNGPERIFVARKGRMELTDRRFGTMKQLASIIDRIVAPIGRRVDESMPYVDARLERDGSRVHIILPPLALDGPTVTIRKFSRRGMGAADLVAGGSCTEGMMRFLDLCVRGRRNVIVSGGTGTGKTTLLNVLSQAVSGDERVITIEDSAELRLSHLNLVRLEARRANVEGRGEVTIRDLVRNALRMRPDRIIVGECRGSEAFDMLQAMNTGHEGSMTTLHANTPRDMLARLEGLVMMAVEMPVAVIRRNIASAVQVVVQIARLSDGSRKIERVSEVLGMQGDEIAIRDIFVYEQTGLGTNGRAKGLFRATGHVPTFCARLRASGLQIDENLFQEGISEETERLVATHQDGEQTR